MKVIVLFAHPNPVSFNAGILKEVQEVLHNEKVEVILKNLYDMNFNPVFSGAELGSVFTGNGSFEDVEKEQEIIRASDLVIVIYPIWWFGPPAILKGYIDRVFTHGFSFVYSSEGVIPLMTGKKAFIIQTGGNSPEAYDAFGLTDVPKDTIGKGTFGFMGFETEVHTLLSVQQVSAAQRADMLIQVKQSLNQFIKK